MSGGDDAPPSTATARRSPRACTAIAGTNIALVKYWGKRDRALNLPATGSLSLTLAELGTRTTVRFVPGPGADQITLNGAPAADKVRTRVTAFLDRVRARAGIDRRAEVVTANSVPTASGLASSASGFAALALAASRAAGLTLSQAELSELARLGSGSAARSIFGGFVEMAAGSRADGHDAVAAPLAGAGPDTDADAERDTDAERDKIDSWDLRLVVAVTAAGEKAAGSTDAMEHSARTSPFYSAWVAGVPGDLGEARAAIAARDLPRLGAVAERSALRMHATAMAADPPIIYWNPATLAAMQATRTSPSTPVRTSRCCAPPATPPRSPLRWAPCPACCARSRLHPDRARAWSTRTPTR